MSPLQEKFPEQFTGPYFLGVSVDKGWLPIIERACQRMQDELSPEELKAFAWAQIKEKFGRLCLYWHGNQLPVTIYGADGMQNLKIDVSTQESQPKPMSLSDKVEAIVCAAEREAERTCERCGEPGRLYSEGVWQTLCDGHAAADQRRAFPPIYGKWLDARNNRSVDDGEGDWVMTERVMYFSGAAVYSWRTKADAQDFVLMQDVLDKVKALAASLPAHEFGDEPAYLADDFGRMIEDCTDELSQSGLLTMPAGVKINLVQDFSYCAAQAFGVQRAEIEDLVEPRQISIAGFRSPDGMLRIFKREFGEIDEVVYMPAVFLEKRIKELEQAPEQQRKVVFCDSVLGLSTPQVIDRIMQRLREG